MADHLRITGLLAFLLGGLFLFGCSSPLPPRVTRLDPEPVRRGAAPCRACQMSPHLEDQILALNPEHVTTAQIRDVLSQAPAPQVIAIHGGVLPIKAGMNSFTEFLVEMGYPTNSLRNPATGEQAYGYYDDSDALAGALAWFAERDGLRPILIGHSQGGIQVIRILHKLAGTYPAKFQVWNPETQAWLGRDTIIDPVTGQELSVTNVQVSYAAVATAGGIARILPNEWDMNDRLRTIPDSVVEFTGFQKGLDPWGGDLMGYGAGNNYKAAGSAIVRNVRLPVSGAHWTVPYAGSLAEDPGALERIQNYRPPDNPADTVEPAVSTREVFAAEVWFGIKKHWVLELQRLIRARRGQPPAPRTATAPPAPPEARIAD